MNEIASFLSMGGYWPYVWPAYGASALLTGGLFYLSWTAMKRAEKSATSDPRERP